MTIPFVVVAFCYYKIDNPDEKCFGLVNIVIRLIFYVFLFVTGVIAIIATTRGRKFERLKFEPITLSVSLITFLVIIYHLTFRGHIYGDKWIYAETKSLSNISSYQYLTLRKNGNFTVGLFAADFGCSFSGEFRKIGDTIVFDKRIIDKTNEKITTTYWLQPDKLVPLFDTTGKITFVIKSEE